MGMHYHESRVLKCPEDHLFLAIKSQAHQAHLAPGSSVWYLFKCYRMASSTTSASFSMAVLTSACVWVLIGASASAQLSFDYYTRSCPVLFPTVRLTVGAAIAREAQMGASLLRLFFHDCFVNLGGPWWPVKLGRRDARSASQAAANESIPPPTSDLKKLISSFQNVGLNIRDLVAFAGAHTVGLSRCTNFRDWVYNLVQRRGLLHSDQQLFNGGPADSLVKLYSRSPVAFDKDFVVSITRMGDVKSLTGSNGEIRRNCRRVN
ncbi:peroxidase 4-like [Syzygium oleosum]|uniref:peroxidase 4-like n=1 Tax=Syzygium oleosum TaxID=219896 RepID=UPI0024B885ED|nr:peroxidase 4-like [Syzygium oleosum]